MSLFNFLNGNPKWQREILKIRVSYYNNLRHKVDLVPNVCIFGYYNDEPVPYTAVLYYSNEMISVHQVRPNDDIISFGFTGCYLAKFRIGSETYAAHVPPKQKNNGNWDNFVKTFNIKEDVIIFKPNHTQVPENLLKKSYPAYRCWGIIENDDNCFDLIVYEDITYIDGIYSMVEKKCSCCTIM